MMQGTTMPRGQVVPWVIDKKPNQRKMKTRALFQRIVRSSVRKLFIVWP